MKTWMRRAAFATSTMVLLTISNVAWSRELVIGSISDNLTREKKTFQPLLDYLGETLSAAGIEKVTLSVVTTTESMTEHLRSGRVDVYIDSPFVVAEIGRQVALQPVLRRWKGGVPEYYSIFFTRNDSTVKTLEDLKGKVLALDEPFSTSGYLVPKAVLAEQGYSLVEVAETQSTVDPQKIGYTFSGDDVNTIYWVLKGKAAAGVTDPKHFDKLGQKQPGQLREIARSIAIPRHIVAVRSGMDDALIDAVVNSLKSMDAIEKGRKALEEFQKTKKFDDIPNAAETFQRINAMLDRL